jgi:hypothetical protein
MGNTPKNCRTQGQGGTSKTQDPDYVGWLGQVAHPDSPAGGGGPGGFQRSPSPMAETPFPASDKPPGPVQFIPADSDIPSPPNPPPATNPRSLGTLKEESSDFKDVLIKAKVVADGKAEAGVETSFTRPSSSSPAYTTDDDGKIDKFTGKFKWKGTIEIQTVYGSGMDATIVSCYGRGTTEDDVRNRDITLGFHEHQHQVDYVNYLSNNSLPETPDMKIGMTPEEYKAETDRFKEELANYFDTMESESLANTDEVGHHKSTWESTRECYLHLLP